MNTKTQQTVYSTTQYRITPQMHRFLTTMTKIDKTNTFSYAKLMCKQRLILKNERVWSWLSNLPMHWAFEYKANSSGEISLNADDYISSESQVGRREDHSDTAVEVGGGSDKDMSESMIWEYTVPKSPLQKRKREAVFGDALVVENGGSGGDLKVESEQTKKERVTVRPVKRAKKVVRVVDVAV